MDENTNTYGIVCVSLALKNFMRIINIDQNSLGEYVIVGVFLSMTSVIMFANLQRPLAKATRQTAFR